MVLTKHCALCPRTTTISQCIMKRSNVLGVTDIDSTSMRRVVGNDTEVLNDVGNSPDDELWNLADSMHVYHALAICCVGPGRASQHW
jgi:hypothetical protein